ncbi:MAG TPA: nuclear transport factor 2 family protein [Ilumatobacter sp.]|nr:nuclear transport factor 2 family protein [Ilumatobacter sp.]
MDPIVQRLLDESEIRQVLARYTRAIDRADDELLRTCYHPDAHDVHGDFSGTIDEFVEYLRHRRGRTAASTHFIGNQVIELDGDRAWTETYCLVWLRFAADGDPPERDRFVPVRYCDRFERRAGGWRIADRITVYSPGRIDPVVQGAEVDGFVGGRRDRDDPAYRAMRER